ncbi:MAG: hypothetical protein US69_C0017G0017 [candidate division TM6 bacterium GW2011_GWF2_38_10]|nr:MAG: hypothetical protein US69_C0017G0017 [candidate division TM6 bacterium GW2011_GWF2_38_10]
MIKLWLILLVFWSHVIAYNKDDRSQRDAFFKVLVSHNDDQSKWRGFEPWVFHSENNNGQLPVSVVVMRNDDYYDDLAFLLHNGAGVALLDRYQKIPLDYIKQKKSQQLESFVIDQLVVKNVNPALFHNDITAGIVDLKFDGKKIKICEFGELQRSRFLGFDRLYGLGSLWARFWKICNFFAIKPCYITTALTSEALSDRKISLFNEYGGFSYPSLKTLEYQSLFKQAYNTINGERLFFKQNNVMAIISDNTYQSVIVEHFFKSYPHALLLNHAFGAFANDKILMNRLFDCDELRAYRPKSMIVHKKYTSFLHSKIIQKLQSDWFVIKPLHAAKGYGVIIVKKRDLQQTLSSIIRNPKNLKNLADPAYNYWLRAEEEDFLVEAFAPSKLIEVNGKKYDATMRVVFTLFCDEGKIGVMFLGAYWKLPAFDCSSAEDLTSIHKSSIREDVISSAPVDERDYAHVTSILRNVLPMAYMKMLHIRELNFWKKL